MGKYISLFLMQLGGWRYVGEVPTEKKYVIISAPHTSMWDFVWGKFAFSSKKVNPAIFIKKESFYFPMGILLKCLNAKPLRRGSGVVSLVEQIFQHFEKNEEFCVCITPEGTRDKVAKWKKGFYYIAQKAQIPIYLGIIDYNKKILTIGERFMPTNDYEKDMIYIKSYYHKHKPEPKHPEKFNWDIA
jgi:1-acyl-sn-glycerol-3-phosphate acyltransferase